MTNHLRVVRVRVGVRQQVADRASGSREGHNDGHGHGHGGALVQHLLAWCLWLEVSLPR